MRRMGRPSNVEETAVVDAEYAEVMAVADVEDTEDAATFDSEDEAALMRRMRRHPSMRKK